MDFIDVPIKRGRQISDMVTSEDKWRLNPVWQFTEEKEYKRTTDKEAENLGKGMFNPKQPGCSLAKGRCHPGTEPSVIFFQITKPSCRLVTQDP
jgi:hypothetical protein